MTADSSLQFGRYRLDLLLGRGGMGEVWRAHDTITDRVVAVKLLPEHLADDIEYGQRFRREARLAAALNEPHVVPIHDYGEIDGRLYVDMRLIEGVDLQRLLVRGPLEPARAVAIVEQIAAALYAAHRAGLVHRDIKPSNILITENDFAYLIDFGIAQSTGEAGLTGTGSMIGTWAYMAPERFSSTVPDARSDIYALACVLYECLTGAMPFAGTSVEQLVAAHLNTPAPRPSTVAGVVPAFDAVIARGMAKEPDERFASTIDLAAAARDSLEGLHNRATQAASTPPTQQKRPPHSHSRRSAALVSTVALFVAVLVIVLVLNRTTSGPSDDEMPADLGSGETASAPFAGAFSVTYGEPTYFTGVPTAGDRKLQATWVVRADCDLPDCAAIATKTDGAGFFDELIFDNIGGQWRSVSETVDSTCGGVDGSRWEVYALDAHADGSFTGVWTAVWPSGGCEERRELTVAKLGTPIPGRSDANPADLGLRVAVRAEALHGSYRRTLTYRETGATNEDDYQVQTNCVRTGDRCVSYFYNDQGSIGLLFSNGRWTYSDATSGLCLDGETPFQDVVSAEFPLPESHADPIAVLTGVGQRLVSGGCPEQSTVDMEFTRTGD